MEKIREHATGLVDMAFVKGVLYERQNTIAELNEVIEEMQKDGIDTKHIYQYVKVKEGAEYGD